MKEKEETVSKVGEGKEAIKNVEEIHNAEEITQENEEGLSNQEGISHVVEKKEWRDSVYGGINMSVKTVNIIIGVLITSIILILIIGGIKGNM